MKRILVCIVALVALATAHAQTPAPAEPRPYAELRPAHKSASAERQLNLTTKVWTGDFDGMLDRRIIRVAAPYSQTLFYIDKGRERGIGADLVRGFEQWINKKYAKQLGKRPLTIYIGAYSRDRLLPRVTSGHADIAIGNLSVTDERLKIVDFVAPPGALKANEIVVTGPRSPAIATVDDLAGKTVHVHRSSSYYDSLVAFNDRLKAANNPPSRSSSSPTRSRTRT
jgi:ABC-type amino acid transport substrate-binding protein